MKRARESARAEKREEKDARRARRQADRDRNPEADAGTDPDLAGIVPGPQRSPYADMEEGEEE